jgi:hypothetical protein
MNKLQIFNEFWPRLQKSCQKDERTLEGNVSKINKYLDICGTVAAVKSIHRHLWVHYGLLLLFKDITSNFLRSEFLTKNLKLTKKPLNNNDASFLTAN